MKHRGRRLESKRSSSRLTCSGRRPKLEWLFPFRLPSRTDKIANIPDRAPLSLPLCDGSLRFFFVGKANGPGRYRRFCSIGIASPTARRFVSEIFSKYDPAIRLAWRLSLKCTVSIDAIKTFNATMKSPIVLLALDAA
jgi:hypothetical protein